MPYILRAAVAALFLYAGTARRAVPFPAGGSMGLGSLSDLGRRQIGRIAVVLVSAAFAAAAAPTAARADAFYCQATGVEVEGSAPRVHGSTDAACQPGESESSDADATLDVVSAKGLRQWTSGDSIFGDGRMGAQAISEVERARVTLPGLVVEAENLSAGLTGSCNGYGVDPFSPLGSGVGFVSINGLPIGVPFGGNQTEIRRGDAVITLNYRLFWGSTGVASALVVRLGAREIRVATARVGMLGDPCAPPPRFQCSDGIDNDGDSKTDFPADTGCLTADDDDEKRRRKG